MTENNKKGTGKFFLGALLGAAAGAIAGKFVSEKLKDDAGNCENDDCKCGEKCECGKKDSKETDKMVIAKEKVEKKAKEVKGKVEKKVKAE